jgi:hypothetical protein
MMASPEKLPDCKVIFNDFIYQHVNNGLIDALNRTFDCKRGVQFDLQTDWEHGLRAVCECYGIVKARCQALLDVSVPGACLLRFGVKCFTSGYCFWRYQNLRTPFTTP